MLVYRLGVSCCTLGEAANFAPFYYIIGFLDGAASNRIGRRPLLPSRPRKYDEAGVQHILATKGTDLALDTPRRAPRDQIN